MLVLMTAPYGILRLINFVTGCERDLRDAAAFGLAMLFAFTGSGHFADTDSMVQMLPSWVPARMLLVYLTGIFEFGIATGFLLRKSRRAAGCIAAALLILFFPANVYAAIHHVPQGGHAWGPIYLLIRAPVQLLILFWNYWFVIRSTE
jgi:uncharacterized membrane protein